MDINKQCLRVLLDDLRLVYNGVATNAVMSCSSTLVHLRRTDTSVHSFDNYFTPLGIAFFHVEDAMNDVDIINSTAPSIIEYVRYYDPPAEMSYESESVVFTFNQGTTDAWSTTVYRYHRVLEDVYGLPKPFWDDLFHSRIGFQQALDSKGYFKYCIDKLQAELYNSPTITLDDIHF